MTELAWHWVPALQSTTGACTLVSGQLAHCSECAFPKTRVLAAKQRQSLEKETRKWASRCVHMQCLPSAKQLPAKLPAGQGSTGSGTDAGRAAGSPTATAGAVVRLQRWCQQFLSTLTPCKWALASLAWSIPNPSCSVKVWKPTWAFLYRDIRHDESMVEGQHRRKHAKFRKYGHGLKLVLARKKQTVTFLISPAQSTSFCIKQAGQTLILARAEMTLFLMEVGRKRTKEAELLRVCNERWETKHSVV